MRQVTRKGLMTVAAATGVLAVTGGYAHADSAANGTASDSPGVLSGNSVQAPVHVPVNVCGNTVNVVGLLNPAAGNACVNQGGGNHSGDRHGGHRGGGHGQGHGGHGGHGGYGEDDRSGGGHGGHGGGSGAHGHTGGSPGVGSGNHVEVPVDVPVNVCGNNITAVGLGNPVTGNDCVNTPGEDTPAPPVRHTPPGHTTPPGGGEGVTPHTPAKPGGGSAVQAHHPGSRSTLTQPVAEAQLAHTGSESLGLLVPAGAAALLGGTLLYRRSRAGAR
ncbi:chaplin [Streptomyces sp. ME02-6978a]|uniref:chaplin n=1 Tax=unclassified Streptomyces TaxID=2593676 RepID=UPI0029A38EB2|nr:MULTISPECIES: chaplin [unclassified Streptomyces]MDX3087945.1 chaplin [Streptomyces sp. ME12-02E]MDX3331302.1 chaplin [Streptomyces sp. ME02-6978a]